MGVKPDPVVVLPVRPRLKRDIPFKSLNLGIKLEKSKSFIPWRADFDTLRRVGLPEQKDLSGKRILVWKGEKILGGLNVDLNVMYEPAFFCNRHKLCNVSAYIGGSEFERSREFLANKLGKKARFKQLNDVEYSYSWKVNRCVVTLSHLDRMGSFYRFDVTRRLGIEDIFGMFKGFYHKMVKSLKGKGLKKTGTGIVDFLQPLLETPGIRYLDTC